MGVVADKLRDKIKQVANTPVDALSGRSQKILDSIRNGGGQEIEEAEKLMKDLDDLEEKKEQLETTKQQFDNTLNTIEATKTTATTTKEANEVGSALNPAAAAIKLIQEKLEEKLEKEIEDIGAAKDSIEPAIENIKDFVSDTKRKVLQAIKDKKRQLQLKKDRAKALGK